MERFILKIFKMSKFKEKQKKISGKNSEIEDMSSEKQESQLDEDFEKEEEISSLQKMADESKDVEELEKTEKDANKELEEKKTEDDSKKEEKSVESKESKKSKKNLDLFVKVVILTSRKFMEILGKNILRHII